MPRSHKGPFPSLAEAERLIRAGRTLLSWPEQSSRPGCEAEAERCFRGALEILRDAVRSAHPQLALAWDRLGVLYEEMGDPEEAETCYLRSLAAQQAAGWASSIGQGLTVRRLGRLYERMGKRRLQEAVMRPLQRPTLPTSPVPDVAAPKRAAALTRHRRGSMPDPNEIKRFMFPPPRGDS